MITITSIIILICCFTAMLTAFYKHSKTQENIFCILGILNATAVITTFIAFLFNFGH